MRSQRKALRLSATVTAEAAGISRVTLHRIEKGEASVAMGAWFSALGALGMTLQASAKPADQSTPLAGRKGWIPPKVMLADYPQLRSLVWQVHGTDWLTPTEAWDIFERNARHLDLSAMSADERDLRDALRMAFSSPSRRVEGTVAGTDDAI
ncbi:MAG: helix-turn-helix transcriptional regulator [Hylemonella sp.]|nr:helix-turn-helix transcriptional regulator [Hylemonella sp.]